MSILCRYDMQRQGLLNPADMQTLPDVYTQNLELRRQITLLWKELDDVQENTRKEESTFKSLQKQVNFYRLHHQRTLQEKKHISGNLKRLQAEVVTHTSSLKQLKEKYEVLFREKALMMLEKEKAAAQISELQALLCTPKFGENVHTTREAGKPPEGRTQKALRMARLMSKQPHNDKDACDQSCQVIHRHSKDSDFPTNVMVKPELKSALNQPCRLLQRGNLKQLLTLKAHTLPINSITLHPKKKIVVSASDDMLWKMWLIPEKNPVMVGKGHKSWLSDCSFHQSCPALVTASGDRSVCVWDTTQARTTLILEGHSQAVWSCAWQTNSDLIASGSADATAKIWDMKSERCRNTIRGHTDVVNSVRFLPFSSILLTSSADKTLSLWDVRTGLCTQTLFGHKHSCNDASFNPKGDMVASCDSHGTVILWDLRTFAITFCVNTGRHSANAISFDPSGRFLAVANEDGSVKLLVVNSGVIVEDLDHGSAVRTLVFNHGGDGIISGCSDGTIRIWGQSYDLLAPYPGGR
uniref:sperm-associated antigen 16 protein isoform X2 n=1 Tax=Myxine glutinosa TaxID=7769 RepID=UPI00358F08F5